MEKTMRFLSIAALALVGAVMTGCSSEDNFIGQPQQQVADNGNVVTVTATVGLGEQAGTRKLTIDGSKGVKTFAEGDQIAVIYENESGMVKETVTIAAGDISTDGKSAKITVTMTDPKAGGTLKYIYPAAMAGATDVDYTKLNTQDGTLDNLGKNLDLAVFDGNLTDEAALPATASLENKLSILAVTLKNETGLSEITGSTTKLTVSDGNNIYTITGKDADGHIYVAIKPTNSATIGVNATAGTTHYYKELANKTYAKDNGYSVSWKMAQGAHLSAITADFTANHGDVLTGTLKSNVKISIADGATVTLKNVQINEGWNWDSGNYAGITCAGDATITLDGMNEVMGFDENYPSIQVPEGNTLTINGDGVLYAINAGFGAGIGGGYSENCGNIDIKGGTIIAQGGSYGAGIGSSAGGSCGTITISGGKISAHGGPEAAGIGSGASGSCSNITITSGVTYVDATGGEKAAGIGGGNHASCDNIEISGGNIISAEGGYNGAGIGGGEGGSCGAIYISGGTVTATGGSDAAGIGGGVENKACGTITITNGVTSVEATKGSDDAQSIGKGKDGTDIYKSIEDPSKVTEN